ncbi:hypothetical protein J7E88_10650 [Streptomyces sp. ISL-10]|uniref:hypothetical protein n=1 Tax=Streptomyces sp. ISL-10 TaxID=2819172 RepID=UPI001BEAF201|nr:hypothetical protein [Streptomyces sp. ISL-10]MBT2365759.1 hypothetical protein [Streptomyces sp. ISL-10]
MWGKVSDPEPPGVTVHHSYGIVGCVRYTDATLDEMRRNPYGTADPGVDAYDGEGYPPELVLTLQTPTPKAVVVTGVKVKVLKRAAVPNSGVIVVERACGGSMMTRPFDVDLSKYPVKVLPRAADDGTTVDFPLKVSESDPEQLGLELDPGDWHVRFTVEVEWVADGERGSKVLDNNGRGFEVTGTGDLPTYMMPERR